MVFGAGTPDQAGSNGRGRKTACRPRPKYMTTLTTWEMAEEMQKCRQALETMFGRIVKGMAYPYGWYDEKLKNVLAMSGVTYSRTVESTLTFDFPDDWLQWHPTCHHDYPQLSELTKQFVDMKVTEWPKMFYLWGHTFEFEDNDNWWIMENFMKAVSGREDIWYATNGEIYDYVKVWDPLTLEMKTAVSCCVGTGNQTWVLCQSNKSFFFLMCSPGWPRTPDHSASESSSWDYGCFPPFPTFSSLHYYYYYYYYYYYCYCCCCHRMQSRKAE